MVSQTVVIKNPTGLHARPAANLAKAAAGVSSKITLTANGKTVQAKSALMIMSAAIKCGTEVVVAAEGENEAADLKAIVELIESGLGE